MKFSREKTDRFVNCQNLMIIPFYKNVNLVKRQIDNIINLQSEIEKLHFGILAINDSPDIGDHKLALREGIKVLEDMGLVVEYVENGTNVGFVKSANIGLNFAAELNLNALLVNSDAFISPGSLIAMHEILLSDEKVGFVGPRSNNASIASIPWDLDIDLEKISFGEIAELAQKATSQLPRYQIVPVIPGSVMWIKSKVLLDVGVFDEIFSPGYNEENDLTMRANQTGYISVMANHAFAYHLKSISFGSNSHNLEIRNSRILEERYPYYYEMIHSYSGDIDRIYEKLLVHLGLNLKRPTLVLDLTFLRTDKTGTAQVTLAILGAMFNSTQWEESFDITILVEKEVEEYHGLGYLREKFDFLTVKTLKDRVFCARLYLSQPFSINDDIRGLKIAAVNLYYFLDNIAYDCFYLRVTHTLIDTYWELLARRAVGLVFLTEYSRSNFYFRFDRKFKEFDFVALPSFELKDYKSAGGQIESSGSVADSETMDSTDTNALQVLVVGNKFLHKRVDTATKLLLERFKDIKIVELGSKSEQSGNLNRISSGQLTDDEVAKLYQNADLVIFPTNYEGFGFPLLNALAFNKNIVVFDLEVFQELTTHMKQLTETKSLVSNIHKVSNYKELIEFVTDFRKVQNLSQTSGDIVGLNLTEDKTWGWNNTLNVFYRALITGLEDKRLQDNLRENLNELELWELSLAKSEKVTYMSFGYRLTRKIYRSLPPKLGGFIIKLFKR